MKLCEAPIDVLRGAIRTYQRTEHPATGKMGAEELVEYMRAHPKARKMIPKSYRQDKQADIPLSIVRKTILQYRRKHHPAPSKLRRAELERYMRRVKIKPVGKELSKLKRDHCPKKGEVNEDAVILSAEHAPASEKLSAPVKGPKKKAKKKLDMARVMALADDSDDEPPPPKRRRGRPRKVKGKTEGQRTEAEILQGLEARAAQMDEDTSLAW